MIAVFAVTFLIEVMVSTGRSPMVAMALMLILHLLPTLWLPFRDFDRKSEGTLANIYAYSGPVGYGIFLAAGIHAWLNPTLQEEFGVPFWMAVLVTVVTYFSYWLSSTMSNKALFELFTAGGYPSAIVQLVVLLRTLRYHNLAKQLMEATIKGWISTIDGPITLQWRNEVRTILLSEHCDEGVLDKAMKALLHL